MTTQKLKIMSKPELEKINTPAGIAKYPRLNTPDTKFNKNGVYKVTLVLDESDEGVTEFKDRILAAEEASVAEATKTVKKGKQLKVADSLIKAHLNDADEVVDGMFEVSAKTVASGQRTDGSKWERRLPIFDAKGKRAAVKIGGGSKLRLALSLSPYNSPTLGAGVSLYLDAVKVIDLKEFKGEESADGYGFGEAEEGFSAAEDPSFPEDSNQGAEPDAPAEEPAPAPAKKTVAKPGAKPAPAAAAKPRAKGDF